MSPMTTLALGRSVTHDADGGGGSGCLGKGRENPNGHPKQHTQTHTRRDTRTQTHAEKQRDGEAERKRARVFTEDAPVILVSPCHSLSLAANTSEMKWTLKARPRKLFLGNQFPLLERAGGRGHTTRLSPLFGPPRVRHSSPRVRLSSPVHEECFHCMHTLKHPVVFVYCTHTRAAKCPTAPAATAISHDATTSGAT